MSTSRTQFLGIIGEVDYAPRTLTLRDEAERLFASLSEEASGFFHLAADIPFQGGQVSLLKLIDWRLDDDRILRNYWTSMGTSERAEILFFESAFVHELTHHIDFLSTPFGLNFHLKTIREYLHLQDLVPDFLDNPEAIPDRLVDFGATIDRLNPDLSKVLRPKWDQLVGIVRTLEAWGDGGKVRPNTQQIVPGRMGDTSTQLRLFDQDFDWVTVNEFFITFSLPGEQKWYFRPLTIFETRAVAHSLLWTMECFGEDGQEAAALLYSKWYEDTNVLPDYFFLFRIIAEFHSYGSFGELLTTAGSAKIREILGVLSTACWYALHAPPPIDANSSAICNPVLRLLLFLFEYEDLALGRKKGKFASFSELADFINGQEAATRANFLPATRILHHCERVLHHVAGLNQHVLNPEIRSHFERVLNILSRNIVSRIPNGYASELGLPANGNPLYGMDDHQARLLLDLQYRPEDVVVDWFSFRDRFLFLFHPRERTISKLYEHFGYFEFLIHSILRTEFRLPLR